MPVCDSKQPLQQIIDKAVDVRKALKNEVMTGDSLIADTDGLNLIWTHNLHQKSQNSKNETQNFEKVPMSLSQNDL